MDTTNHNKSQPSSAIINQAIEALYERIHPQCSSKTADLKNEFRLTAKKPEDTEFYIERLFLENYFTKAYLRVGEALEGTFHDNNANEDFDCQTIEIASTDSIDGPPTETLQFIYYLEDDRYTGAGRLALAIVDTDASMLYWRSQFHDDLKTEWYINCYAQDLTDENGTFIFDGEPVCF